MRQEILVLILLSAVMLSGCTRTSEESYSPPGASGLPEILIRGDGECITQTKSALDLLAANASEQYAFVATHVGVIECVESGSGINVLEKPPRFKVGRVTREAGTVWYASTIVHDACHSRQYQDHLRRNPSADVPPGMYSGRNAEEECIGVQMQALEKIGGSQRQMEYLGKVIDTKYWEVDYGNRWW